MDKVYQIAADNELWVVEDAATSLGAKYKGKYVGGFHNGVKGATAFSFCPTKTITTAGGGMVTISDSGLYEEIKMRAYQGYGLWIGLNRHQEFAGHKFNMPALHAAIGLVQLRKLDQNLARRRELASFYAQELGDLHKRGAVKLQSLEADYSYEHGHCYFPVQMNPLVMRVLAYHLPLGSWPAVHLTPFYRGRYGYERGTYPEAEHASSCTAHIPFSENLPAEQAQRVVGAIKGLFR